MGVRRYSGSSIEDEEVEEDDEEDVVVDEVDEEAVDIAEGEVDDEADGDSILQSYKASRRLKNARKRGI